MPGLIKKTNMHSVLYQISRGKYPDCLSTQEINNITNNPRLFRPTALRDRAIMQVLYSTGIRPVELINLKLTDIDIENNLIRINLKPRWFSQIRVVPIGRTACAYIQIYLKKTRPLFAKENDEGCLFLKLDGGKITNNVIIKQIKTNARRCGSKQTINANHFSIAYAVHMHRNGADINYLKQTLGFLNRGKGHKTLSIDELKEIYFKCHPTEKYATIETH